MVRGMSIKKWLEQAVAKSTYHFPVMVTQGLT